MLHTGDTQALEYAYKIANMPGIHPQHTEISSKSLKNYERWITDKAIVSAQPFAIANYIENGWNIDSEKAITRFDIKNKNHTAPLQMLSLLQELDKKDSDEKIAFILKEHKNLKDFKAWRHNKKQLLLISLISMNYPKSMQVLLDQGAPLINHKITDKKPLESISLLSTLQKNMVTRVK